MDLILPLADEIFYPSDPAELSALIDSLLDKAGPSGSEKNSGKPSMGIITPHGAYDFTGALMARAYGAVKHLKPDWILLAAPVHLDQDPGIFLPPEDGFQTPLGKVPVFREAREILKDEPSYSLYREPYREEPALELQLPFIRHLFPDVPVLPLYMAGGGRKMEKALARGLQKVGTVPLMVITSNLSSYEIPRLSEAKAREFLETAAREGFDPRRYPEDLYRPCGLSLLGGVWELYNGSLKMDLLDWASDRPEGNEDRKCAFYGAFTLNAL